MNSHEVADRAVQISELIEEIIRLDELLALHEKYEASATETQQYLDRRSEFIEALNQLLDPHKIQIVAVDQRA